MKRATRIAILCSVVLFARLSHAEPAPIPVKTWTTVPVEEVRGSNAAEGGYSYIGDGLSTTPSKVTLRGSGETRSTLLTEPFSYPDGNLVGNGSWTAHSALGLAPIQVNAGKAQLALKQAYATAS